MERVLSRMPQTICMVYLDDLLVHVKTFEGGVQNLGEVQEVIRAVGLHLIPKKCALF